MNSGHWASSEERETMEASEHGTKQLLLQGECCGYFRGGYSFYGGLLVAGGDNCLKAYITPRSSPVALWAHREAVARILHIWSKAT